MLQFNKSQQYSTNAGYVDSVPTGSYTEIVIDFTQSMDNSVSTYDAEVLSKPDQYNKWLLFRSSGSQVPSPTGQYDVNVWAGLKDGDLTWAEFSTLWTNANITWDSGEIIRREEFLFSDRAFVSGSNNEAITQYVSSNENGTYITYNG